MSYRIFIFALLILAAISPLRAQSPDLTNGIGLSAGVLSGIGFSYRHFPMSSFGWQISGIYTYSGGGNYLSVGVEPLFILHRNENTGLYLLAGVGYFDEGSGSDSHNYYGFGFGYSLCTLERIWTSLDLAMAFSHDKFLPYPQASIHYLLK